MSTASFLGSALAGMVKRVVDGVTTKLKTSAPPNASGINLDAYTGVTKEKMTLLDRDVKSAFSPN